MTKTEWLAARKSGLGGTDIAAIMLDKNRLPLHPYKTPMTVYSDKLSLVDAEPPTMAMRVGLKAEQMLSELYIEETGRALVNGLFRRSLKHSWHVGTPDRIALNDPLLIELKTAGLRSAHRWGETGTDEIPQEYLLQVLWYLELLDLPKADLAVLIGNDFRIYNIPADTELQGIMLDAAGKFWTDHILAQVPPPPTGAKPDTEFLKRLYKQHGGEMLTATDGQNNTLKVLHHFRNLFSETEMRKKAIENELKAVIGSNAGVDGLNFAVTWNNENRVGWKAVAKEAGATKDQIEKHTKEIRKLRFKEKK